MYHAQVFLEKQGILHRRSVSNPPEKNGTAERKLIPLPEMTRCFPMPIPNKLWDNVIMTVTYLQKRLLTKATKKTPFESWHGRVSSVGYSKISVSMGIDSKCPPVDVENHG